MAGDHTFTDYQHPTVGRPHDPNAPKYIEVYGHRGTRAFSPENTLPGYKAALEIGSDWIDIDIGVSADGILVGNHEYGLNPDTTSLDGTFWAKSEADFFNTVNNAPNPEAALQPYLIRNLTLAQLKKYDLGVKNPSSSYGLSYPDQVDIPGTRMPSLQEVVDFVHEATGKKMYFQIEIKNDPTTPTWTVSPQTFASTLYAFLKLNQLIDHVEIQAFDWQSLYEIQKLDKKIKTAYLMNSKLTMLDPNPAIAGQWSGGKLLKDYNNSLPLMIKSLGGACYEPRDTNLTQEEVVESHALGLKVVPWAVSTYDPVNMAKYIDWGVDGIILDDPGRLNSALAARNMQVPATYRSKRVRLLNAREIA